MNPIQHNSYTVPHGGDYPTNAPGYAPANLIESGVVGVPPQYYPNPELPPTQDPRLNNSRIVESKQQETQGVSDEGPLVNYALGYRHAPMSSPYLPPPSLSRPMHVPSAYSFIRKFDQHSARNLNGNHFSAANLQVRAQIPTRGMQATHPLRRNTYRIEPPPRDIAIVDSSGVTNVPSAVYEQQPANLTSQSKGRTWRLL